MKRARLTANPLYFAVFLATTVSTPALASGQLPGNAVPINYDIRVDPDAQAKTFTGQETITLNALEGSRTITLNAADLQITSATIDGKKATFKLVADVQQLVVTAPKVLLPGKHVLRLSWSGKINDTAAGLFSIDYSNPDGKPARMLATQFEAADARRFAPLWDEPAYKATFRLTTTAPVDQTAFSNMPVATSSKGKDGRKTVTFQQSPIMSSYLLFLGIGDVERKTVMAGKTEIGIITRRGVVDQGDYALAQAKRLLAYYNDYFGQPYPLPKLDMIAGPGSSQFFGAMENWGAIFYFEPEVLFDPKRATQSGRERIFTVVAHEMAHQWFGDLVTMNWWDDLWLNEGFASWMENKTAIDLNPEWQARESAVAFDREGAMIIDATAATHPIIRHVVTVDQLGDAFDGITYKKGQAVIGMIESTLGPDVFRDGIRRYMAKYHYHNTETDQLWAELATAAGKPVADVAHSFTLQGGVPLLTLTGTNCTNATTTATISQTRFGLDALSKKPQTWQVPARIAVLGGGETSAIVSGEAASNVSVSGCGTLVLNYGKGSYFRSRYTPEAHAAIVRDFSKLPLADQIGTLGDDLALALSGDQDFARWADTVAAVPADGSALEWDMITGQLGTLTGLVNHTPLVGPIRQRTIALLAPQMKRVGFTAEPGEPSAITNLREGLVGRLGSAGDADVIARARAYVAALQTDPGAIPPAIRQPILSTFAIHASQADWDSLLAITLAEKNPVARNGYVRLLGAARDEAIAKRALDLLTGDKLTAPQKGSLLAAIAGQQPDLAFDWAVAHLDIVNGFLETSNRAGFVVGLASGSNDPAMPGKIKDFADKNLPEASRGPARRAITLINTRKQAHDRVAPGIAAWLGVAN
jgi:aminopeptidase N